MKTNLFYLHVMVLMCAFNMQASSNSSSNRAGAAASASAVAGAAGWQMKTKYDASQAGQGVSMTAITPQVPNSGSSSSAGAAAHANAAPVIAAPASAAAIAAGVAQAQAQQEKYTAAELATAKAALDGFIKDEANVQQTADKEIQKIEESRNKALADINNKKRNNLYYKWSKEQEELLAQKASEARKALAALRPVDKPNEQRLRINIQFYEKQMTIYPYASDNVLMLYYYARTLHPDLVKYGFYIKPGTKQQTYISNISEKMTIGEALGVNTLLRFQDGYTPAGIVRTYNTQMGK